MTYSRDNDDGLLVLSGFIGVFALFLFIFLLIPGMWINPYIHIITQGTFTMLVVYTLFFITKNYYVLFLGISLIIPFLLLNAYSIYASSIISVYRAYIFYVVLLAMAIPIAMTKVLTAKKINTNLLCGALIIYLFSGLLWAKLYFIIEGYLPGSFKGVDGVDIQGSDLIVGYAIQYNCLYYSFSTLTTLGIGDIAPVHRIAKSLTMLEAMFGQLYVATVIAKLVSVWQRRQRTSQKENA